LIAPTLPLLVDQVRRTTERVSGGVRAMIAHSPRVAIVAALVAVVLLGVAIGYAAANKSNDATTSGEAGGQLDGQRFPAGTGSSSDSARAARRDSAARRATAAPGRRTATGVRRSARRRGRGGAAAGESAVQEPAAVDSLTTPPDGTRPVSGASGADSTPAPAGDSIAARTTASAASKVGTDSAAAEREALRLELERRRARLDSIARRVQGLKPDQR
jgi:hypothetical protein